MLARCSPANRPERTCYYMDGAWTARLARTVCATLSTLHRACAPTSPVRVVPPGYPTAPSVWGLCCTEYVNSPSDLSLLRERFCFDPRERVVNWPSDQAGLHYGVSLPRSRHCHGFRRKGAIHRPSAHTKPAVLNLVRTRFPDSTASGEVRRPSVQAYIE